jgi:hypothetical protein
MTNSQIYIIKIMAKQSQIFYKRAYLCVYTAVNRNGYILYKANHQKKGRRHDYDVYKKNHPVTPKQVVNVVEIRYL